MSSTQTTKPSKPTLPALRTPVTSTFPVSDGIPLSAFSVRTPLSARSACREPFPSAGLPSAGLPSGGLTPGFLANGPLSAVVKSEEKTPITPPLAYLDFLRSINLPTPSLTSPPTTGKLPLNRTSTSGSTVSNVSANSDDSAAHTEEDGETTCVESGPSTATSDGSDCSCACDHVHKSPGGSNNYVSSNSISNPQYPLSAPPTGPTTFPSLRIPRSPATNGIDSPVQSPFSARSVRSPFDWDAALKARRFAEVTVNGPVGKGGHSHSCGKTGRTSVRNIREVVTRTVTYTPRMDPAPKGKRRKVE